MAFMEGYKTHASVRNEYTPKIPEETDKEIDKGWREKDSSDIDII